MTEMTQSLAGDGDDAISGGSGNYVLGGGYRILGDVNLDGAVDSGDSAALADAVGLRIYRFEADINQDG